MRIVYDDTMQGKFTMLLRIFLGELKGNMKSVTSYSWGMDRVDSWKVKDKLNRMLECEGFEVGKNVTHANGIGNNCKYPVYYYTYDETQLCAYININSGLYSEVYVSVEDYNCNKVSNCYELTPRGIFLVK